MPAHFDWAKDTVALPTTTFKKMSNKPPQLTLHHSTLSYSPPTHEQAAQVVIYA